MRATPSLRISIGLVSLTVCLLILAKILGFAPDRTKEIFESRKNLSEALALQLSAAASASDMAQIKTTLHSLVQREDTILSAALRNNSGELLAETGDHLIHWQPLPGGRSTPDFVQIPIFMGQSPWATMEISFAPLSPESITGNIKGSYMGLVLFIGLAGFIGYFLMMKRTLRELDPTAVIPQRVKAAFDVLKEGVLILDEQECIVLANNSFAGTTGKKSDKLIGLKGSELNWKGYKNPQQQARLPWIQVLSTGDSALGTRLVLESGAKRQSTFVVNAAPVTDNNGECRGVLVTFDDITDIESKNIELKETVNRLEETTLEIRSKNRELEFLATHDPLTQLLNRRSLGAEFNNRFNDAVTEGRELSCIMCDIDHFKSVNDRYGHATGDKVIQTVAAILQKNSRRKDLIGRYGGEEFCLVMVDLSAEQAVAIANRMRLAIKEDLSCGVPITCSFGVSSMIYNANGPDELANQADKALYVAKESGRNRVVCWGGDESSFLSAPNQPEEGDTNEASPVAEDVAADAPDVQRLTVRLQELEELVEKRSQELKHQSAYDSLTGLPTRTLFHDRVKQAMVRGNRYDNIVAVLSMSIQTVQRIHDVLGHNAGEQFLKEISRRLNGTLRAMDTVSLLTTQESSPTVARLGQEDFGILLVGLDRVDAVTWIVKRLLDSFANPFTINDNRIFATANIGVSIYPFDGESPEILETNAAIAKRHAQETLGENKYYFYSDKLNKSSRKHLELESQLHNALNRHELFLHYQPKISMATKSIVGMEALIRWNNPEIGPVPPFEFIPIAEYSGLIVPIGDWVLNEACRQTKVWLDQGIPYCNMAINFSAKQFREENLTDKIANAIKTHDLPPHCVTVEVTESLMMENLQTTLQMLRRIHGLGVNIALDDFGTGYSSLSYLKNFPLTHVKIDRSFVADIENNSKDAVMVESIINMAHGIDLKVTAEGVENDIQAEMLESYGCDEMQGFLFSKPIPHDEATRLLHEKDTYLSC